MCPRGVMPSPKETHRGVTMGRTYGEAPRGAAGAPSRYLLSAVFCANLFLIFVTLFHNTNVRTQWQEVDDQLNDTAAIGKDLLRRVDNLTLQVWRMSAPPGSLVPAASSGGTHDDPVSCMKEHDDQKSSLEWESKSSLYSLCEIPRRSRRLGRLNESECLTLEDSGLPCGARAYFTSTVTDTMGC